ncbi:MAG: phosphatidate cytidylyltransferase [Hyphomicrobiales bacterium]
MSVAPASPPKNNLALRVISALILAPLAVAAAYFGGWLFAAFWGIAALAILWEWIGLVIGPNSLGSSSRLIFYVGAVAIAAAIVIIERGRPGAAILIIALGAIACAIFAPAARRFWVSGGVLYAGAVLAAPVVIRFDAEFGFAALVFLFLIVWGTDVFGYFGGRMIGGPKLAPSMSPKKTWSGAIAGTFGAIIVGVLVAKYAGVTNLVPVAIVAFVLSAAAQAGDLFESWVKRQFGAKDSGNLIPGHGGVMDRLDGFLTAAVVGALIGFTRGGLEASGGGLMLW